MNALAGQPVPPSLLVDVPKLITAYYTEHPDPTVANERVAFGTSGHRGSSFLRSFNEDHIVAISQAICDYRRREGIDGPLYLGMDTHALSQPASASALEVLAANGVSVMVADGSDYTPTPVISHAILTYNLSRDDHLADGIVITPSHNPPDSGGFKYNPPNGGPADVSVTRWIEARANEHLAGRLREVSRMTLERARSSATTRRHDYLGAYVRDLGAVVDMEPVRASGIRLGVDPLGGAGIDYWQVIAERYGLNLTVTNPAVDPTFRFMTIDWDGRIRMDPSSSFAMRGLVALREKFDVAFACDTDHDRHGIVTRSEGLLQPNAYLAVAVSYLFGNRPAWSAQLAVGKTAVTSLMVDRAAAAAGRAVYETPVGFKWFVDGLLHGSLAFAGEESAGATLLRRDGGVWTTDKDGIALALLSAEMTARSGRDPAELYRALAREVGAPLYERLDAPASPQEKRVLAGLSADQIARTDLAGEPIDRVLTRAPGNDAPLGGVKVVTANGWFAARPSGTENIYKIYAESLRGADHLRSILEEAQAIVAEALAAAGSDRGAIAGAPSSRPERRP
jgi:phosphoglucomutase